MNPTASVATPAPVAARIDPAAGGTLVTRFGEFAADPDRIITFMDGLYGLEPHSRYLLTGVAGWPDAFKLLQSVDDPQLSLIVVPLEANDGPVDRADFVEACRMLGFDEDGAAMLGIVTMRGHDKNLQITVNLKAPLLIDTKRRLGRQHVFASDKYHLRHPLPADDAREG